jgi:flagellar hook-basal body complex protein FliE
MAIVPVDPKSFRQSKELSTDLQVQPTARGPSFADTLRDYLQDVSDLQREADKAVVGLATGKVDNLHEVLVAMGEADVSFRLMMEIRNKLLEAYREITRMQV